MSGSWSREEVEVTVADYLHMLTMELAGQQYNKTDHRRKLIRLLKNRSEGAVERKHSNISAVLIELGCPYIAGYKPLGNYQSLLYEVVVDRLNNNDLFDRAALAAVQMPAAAPLPNDFSKVVVEPPKLSYSAHEPDVPKIRTAVKRDYIDREARNVSLGLAGEEFVVHYERWRLISGGHERLANKVEHVAKTQGDGLGYDVLSFDTTGKHKLIEVKTTSFGKEKLVEKIVITPGVFTYRYVKPPEENKDIEESDIRTLLDAFLNHASENLRVHGISIPQEIIEKGFFDRLVRMDFLSIILKPDATKEIPAHSPRTLRLPKSPEETAERDRQDQEARLDFLCADFILTTSKENLQLFEMLLQIACGALVAEVILDFQVPAHRIEFKNLSIFLDAPFVMDLLDLSYAENVKYSGELFRQLKESGARVAVFPHSIDEIRGAIKAPLDRFEHGEPVTGPTGSRLRNSAFRAYARSILGGVEPEMKSLGIEIAGTSRLGSVQSLQSFTEVEEEDLSQRIGSYENSSAKIRDAGSIANIIRLRQRADIPMQNLAACRAIFLTRNARLANLSTKFLISRGIVGERSVPPCISDRYMAGLLWISQGGKGKDLSRYRLLANCAPGGHLKLPHP